MFTFVAVVTLALGAGATTAIFSVVHGVLLRPLPYAESDRLVSLWQTPRTNPGRHQSGSIAHVNYLDWKRQAKSFESMALYSRASFVLTGPGDAEVVPGGIATPDFFRVFRAPPIMGRPFTAEEDLHNGPDVVIVSNGFWEEQLGGRPDVLGQTIEVSGRRREIVGVAPPGFDFPNRARLWAPVKNDDKTCGRNCVYLDSVARLIPGATVESARKEMTEVARRLEQAFPNENTDVTVAVASLQEETVGDIRLGLLVLFAAVGMVLLTACANVASLVLVRGVARQGDLAIRSALGAGRSRLLGHLLTESLVLALGGGLLGLLLAAWGVDALKAAAPTGIPRLDEVGFDAPTFAFALGIAAFTMLLFGLGPALQLSRVPLITLMRGRGAWTDRRTPWSRSALLVAEVGLSLMLLLDAGLLLRSLSQLQTVDPGFTPDDLTTFTLSLPLARYPEAADVVRAYEQLDERLTSIPGVRSVARIAGLPLGRSVDVQGFTRPDQPPPHPGLVPNVLFRTIDPDYFRTLGISLVAGRSFEPRDRRGSIPVVIISREMAKQFWRGENALGRQLQIQNEDGPRTIIAIAGNVRSIDLATPPQPEMYIPHAQSDARTVAFVISAGMAPAHVLTAARAVIQGIDPKLPLIRPGTLAQLVDEAMSRPRLYLLLLALFAVLAVVLAAVGVYGVVAYAVSERAREIGIRMALGARAREVVRLMIWHGFGPAIIGVVIGISGALMSARVMAGLLFQVRAHDPMTFAGVTVLLLAVVFLACLIPARRATRIPAATALRGE